MKELKLLPYEVWKSVKSDGRYEVSTMGRVKSLKYGKERILKPAKDKKNYLRVLFSIDSKINCFQVHRLVAETFIPNPQNLPCVNHKDENPLNNQISNLEWCTYRYNLNYGTRNERASKAMTNGKKSKPVYQYTLDGEFVKEWPSTAEVQRQTGWWQPIISSCCRGKKKTAYSYVWKYKQSI